MSLEVGRQVLIQESDALRNCADHLGKPFEDAVELLLACKGRVITCGVGKSGHIARKTAGTLSSTGTPSLFLHAAEAVHGDLGMVTSQDIVLMYSHSGETDELVRLFPPLAVTGATTILITGRAASSAGTRANLVLETFVKEEACPNNLAPTTSTTVMLALSDALALAVMERRGFTSEDFARFHPSGALGKRLLLRVSDVMRPYEEIATVGIDARVFDAMFAITRAGVGAACVVDEDQRLVGFISDGDLRRHALDFPDLREHSVQEIMFLTPTTLEPDLLAVEALEVFQNLSKKIGEVPVVSEGKLRGLLTLKDLLRSGIV